RESSMPEPQKQRGPEGSSSIVCRPSGLSLCRQMNPFRISQAQHQPPSEEVVREGHRDLIIACFQRQREGTIFQRTPPVGKFSRSFLLKQVFVGIHQLPVHEYPQFARPSNICLLRLLLV